MATINDLRADWHKEIALNDARIEHLESGYKLPPLLATEEQVKDAWLEQFQ